MVVVLIVQNAGVLIHCNNAGVGCFLFTMRGRCKIRILDSKLRTTFEEGFLCPEVTTDSRPSRLLKSFCFVPRFVGPKEM